jgi:hypothetical protein
MATKEITIRVTPEAASIYESASQQERCKLDALLSLRLAETATPSRSLREIMSEASREAQEHGLTEDILREILDEE